MVPEGFYIELQEYCGNCPHFEIDFTRLGNTMGATYVIACDKEKRCLKIVEHLKKQVAT